MFGLERKVKEAERVQALVEGNAKALLKTVAIIASVSSEQTVNVRTATPNGNNKPKITERQVEEQHKVVLAMGTAARSLMHFDRREQRHAAGK